MGKRVFDGDPEEQPKTFKLFRVQSVGGKYLNEREDGEMAEGRQGGAEIVMIQLWVDIRDRFPNTT